MDVEEDLCVVEIVSSTSDSKYSSSNAKVMSAADKLKSQTMLNSSKTSIGASSTSLNDSSTSASAQNVTQNVAKSSKKRKARRGSGTSSEEERWLDAIESGKLEQVDDELKKIKDPKLMTARQRAMYERSIDKDTGSDVLLALPTGYKEKVMTAEAIQKAQLKSQKRKQLADEKREKDKRKTMDRLLKKQESKATKMNKNKILPRIMTVPLISYRDSISNGPSLSFPVDYEISLNSQTEKQPPPAIQCGICNENQKRYNCSKTNLPICSFRCYQINLSTSNKLAS